MPIPDITIIDWGRPGAPMVIISDGTTLTLDLPERLTTWHKACASTLHMNCLHWPI